MSSTLNHWLIKSEPSTYSWTRLVADKKTRWDGIRNYQARNHLRAMQLGDALLFYHSNEGKEIVGVARVARKAYPDPTADSEDWSAVDVAAAYPLVIPVTLATIKSTSALTNMQLVTHSRLSVSRVTPAEFALILALGGRTEKRTNPVKKKR